MFNFEEASRKNKEAMDLMVKNYVSMTKGFQTIAMEAAEYSKKSFENSVAHMEKLSGVRSIEAVVELQTTFVKSTYEGYVTEATKIGEMYADLAKDTYKPFEAPMARATNAVQSAMVSAAA